MLLLRTQVLLGSPCLIGDASADIMRTKGIGPIVKWVDDYVFFRLPRENVDSYNKFREETRDFILTNGGQLHKGAQLWFTRKTWPNEVTEEWHEDMRFPIKCLPPRNQQQSHAYEIQDIDEISYQLGIPWQREKESQSFMTNPSSHKPCRDPSSMTSSGGDQP
jgi:hypothetical protein